MVLPFGIGAGTSGFAGVPGPDPERIRDGRPPYPRAWGFFWLSPTSSAFVSYRCSAFSS